MKWSEKTGSGRAEKKEEREGRNKCRYTSRSIIGLVHYVCMCFRQSITDHVIYVTIIDST